MNMKNKFDVEKREDGTIKVMQVIERIMLPEDVLVELAKLNGEFANIETQIKQTEEAIINKQMENKRDALFETRQVIARLINDLNDAMAEKLEELKDELRVRIRKAKKAVNYNHIRDSNQRIICQNQILGPLLNEKGMDMTHPLARQLKAEFEKC